MLMVHLTSVKKFYQNVRSDDWSDVSPELAAEMAHVSEGIKASLKSLFAPFGKAFEVIKKGKLLAKLKNIIGLVFYTIFVLILLAVLLPVVLVQLVLAQSRRYKKSYGFFMWSDETASNIYVNVNLITKVEGKTVDAIVSHEHLHLLQYHWMKQSGLTGGEKTGEMIARDLLCQEYRNNSQVDYLLNQKEIEARLNELVVEHYREPEVLPSNQDEFLEMIMRNKVFLTYLFGFDSEFFRSLKNHFEGEFGKKLKDLNFIEEVRDNESIRELAYAVNVFESEDVKLSFITEAMALMYGNLLAYYGDLEASRLFIESVDNRRLIHKMYKNPLIVDLQSTS